MCFQHCFLRPNTTSLSLHLTNSTGVEQKHLDLNVYSLDRNRNNLFTTCQLSAAASLTPPTSYTAHGTGASRTGR